MSATEALWCTRCKAVFVGEECPAGHAEFLYTSQIPSGVTLSEAQRAQLAESRVGIVLESLRTMALMKGLAAEQLTAIASTMESVNFDEGEAICRQGDRGDFFYVVERGKVRVVSTDAAVSGQPDGVESELGVLGRGKYFGELALLGDAPRAASCVAASQDVACLRLNAEGFTRLLGDHVQTIKSNRYSALVRKIMSGKSSALERIEAERIADQLAAARARREEEAERDPVTQARIRETLRCMPLMAGLTEAQIAQVGSQMEFHEYSNGEAICEQGAMGDTFYIIDSGQVSVVSTDSAITGERDGKAVELAVLDHGKCFGELALLGEAPRAASCYANGPVECLTLAREPFQKALGAMVNVVRSNLEHQQRQRSDAHASEDTERRNTPVLISAAEVGNVSEVERLLSKRVLTDGVDNTGRTALLAASAAGHAVVTEMLLAARADVERSRDDGRTPLLCAAAAGHADVIELLCDEGGARIDYAPGRWGTPLLAAVERGHSACVRALLLNGAQADPAQAASNSHLTAAPLAVAAQHGKVNVVRLLLSAAADIDAPTLQGASPLLLAAHAGHAATVCLLLEAGSDTIDKPVLSGSTPLLGAIQHGHAEVVESLLRHRASPNRGLGVGGATPLLLAAHAGHRELVEMLLHCGADPNISRYHDGYAPLHAAAHCCDAYTVALLVDANADANIQRGDGVTPLLIASQSGDVHMVRVLLKVGAILSPPPPVDSLQPIVLRPGDYSITAEPGTFSRRSRRSKTASNAEGTRAARGDNAAPWLCGSSGHLKLLADGTLEGCAPSDCGGKCVGTWEPNGALRFGFERKHFGQGGRDGEATAQYILQVTDDAVVEETFDYSAGTAGPAVPVAGLRMTIDSLPPPPPLSAAAATALQMTPDSLPPPPPPPEGLEAASLHAVPTPPPPPEIAQTTDHALRLCPLRARGTWKILSPVDEIAHSPSASDLGRSAAAKSPVRTAAGRSIRGDPQGQPAQFRLNAEQSFGSLASALANCEEGDGSVPPPPPPLVAAIAHGHADVSAILLKAGADPNTPAPTRVHAHSIDRDEAISHSKSNCGLSPLLLATQRGSLPMVLALLSAGADPAAASAATPHGATPLYVACQRGDCDIVEALVDFGAPIDQVWRSSKGVPFTVRDIAAYVRPRCAPLLALLDLAGSQTPKLLAAHQRLAVAKLNLRRRQPATAGLLTSAVLDRIGTQCFVVQPRASLSVCRRTKTQRDVTEILDSILHVVISTATAAGGSSTSCSFAAATARLVFDEYDRDSDGVIDRYEMQCFLQQEVVWLLPGEELTRAEWERLCRVLFGECNPVLGVPRAEWCAWYLDGLELPPRSQHGGTERFRDTSVERPADLVPHQVTPVPRTPPKPTLASKSSAFESGAQRETLLSFWANTDPEGLRHEVHRRNQGARGL
eukprot:COSAG02_NODE_2931_length_7716_cov_3.042536_3_plen_1414_part_00